MPISPLDDRYADVCGDIMDFSEKHLNYTRCSVEAKYLLALSEKIPLPIDVAKVKLWLLTTMPDAFDNVSVKTFEQEVWHDIKACTCYMEQQLGTNLVHFGLTSEDVNNIAYSLIFRGFNAEYLIETIKDVMAMLASYTLEWKADVFPTRTHGQMASPSTAGKEFAIPLHRLIGQYCKLRDFKFMAKLNGAVGNFSAMVAAYPAFDWIAFSQEFIHDIGLEHNIITTQVENNDRLSEYLNLVRQINLIVLGLAQDMWSYISYGYFGQHIDAKTVGSSTMPHKINPINFENCEGNVKIANALLHELSDSLSVSRMQRDLSNSTMIRNVGVAITHSYLAWRSLLRGLRSISLNKMVCSTTANGAPEILLEAYQTILKIAEPQIKDPYDIMMTAFRTNEIQYVVQNLEIKDSTKDRLLSLQPDQYIGLATKLCCHVIAEYENNVK